MEGLQKELKNLNKAPRLTAAVDDVDKIIQDLIAAREQVANSMDTHTASMTMTKLQNPMNKRFEAVYQDLKDVSKVQKNLGKSIDKALPLKPLPTEHDAMENNIALINRAIAMHLLREGEFNVASTFITETDDNPPLPPTNSPPALSHAHSDREDTDQPMSDDHDLDTERSTSTTRRTFGTGLPHASLAAMGPTELQDKFTEMYLILQELKAHNLYPAIAWAGLHSAELEARGSNFEFELSQLQYLWLFKGPSVNGLPDDMRNGRSGALLYARENFGRFQARHLKEIRQLANAMVYAPNLAESPYKSVFAIDSAFTDIATSFTREFCSLLGLSAESPLYLAATAGSLALPRLLKYTSAARAKGTAWTTADELAFETPLPQRMVYHSIFVCPVSKEQTTEANPPMMIPCGHVLARETIQKLCKGTRFKCPYCPSDGNIKDARQIIL